MHTIYRAIWRAHTVGAAAFSMLIRLHPQTSFSRPKCSCWKSLTLGRCCSAHCESNHVPFVAYVCGTHREIRFHMKQWVWCAETTYLINLTFVIQSVSQPQPATRWFHVSRKCTYTSLFSFCLSGHISILKFTLRSDYSEQKPIITFDILKAEITLD